LLVERADNGEKGAAQRALKHLKVAMELDPGNLKSRNDFGLALFKVRFIDRSECPHQLSKCANPDGVDGPERASSRRI
jgi:hypothetical protein